MRTLVVALALGLVGCGPSTSTQDLAEYQTTVQQLQATVTKHQSDATTLEAAGCAAEHQRYDTSMRPGLHRLTDMSGGLDDCQRMMGHTGALGMNAMCGSMTSELDRHAAAACEGDAAANHAEAAHHCQAMHEWLTQQQAGAASFDSMGGMMGGGRCAP